MAVRLKRLRDQVVVVTGATSGIGLVTARMAAGRGARLVLAARSEGALRRLADEINRGGGRAAWVVADVGDPDDVHAITRSAVRSFGGFDTWVNNAGVSIYGRIEDVPVDDMRHQMDTNYWSQVYGSLEAVRHLKRRGGGALINVGSTLSDRACILQGPYSATKHAVKGFTDALRMELEQEGAPVSVSLIKPGPIDTPYPVNAKNYMDAEARHPAPAYAPEVVARAILRCAETPTREVYCGGGGKLISVLGGVAPGLVDRYMERVFGPQQKNGPLRRPRGRNALDRPSEHLAERGNFPSHTLEHSAYTAGTLHSALTGAVIAAAALALVGWRTRSA